MTKKREPVADVLEKLGLTESDFDWLASRVASYFEEELRQPAPNKFCVNDKDIEVLAEAVKMRLVQTGQIEMVAQLVMHHIRSVAILACTAGSPNCACATWAG